MFSFITFIITTHNVSESELILFSILSFSNDKNVSLFWAPVIFCGESFFFSGNIYNMILPTDCVGIFRYELENSNGNVTLDFGYRIVPNMRPALISAPPPLFCLFSSFLVSFHRRFLLKNSVFQWFCVHIFAFSLPFLNFNHIFHCFFLIGSYFNRSFTLWMVPPKKERLLKREKC